MHKGLTDLRAHKPPPAHSGDRQALAAVWDRPSPQLLAPAADVEGGGG